MGSDEGSPHRDSSNDHPTVGQHRLGPHVVGQRVVVRRVLPGETGPTGGPAFRDVLGTCTAWDEHTCTVAPETGAPVEIPLDQVVSGKPVPPRPSVRDRTPAREVHLHCLAMWPDVVTEPVGDWLVRSGGVDAEGRAVGRANSVLAVTEPGLPVPEAAARVEQAYAASGRPALAQVVAGSDVEQELRACGWQSARPGEADTLAQVAALSQVLRTLRSRLREHGGGGAPVTVHEDGPRALAVPEGGTADGTRARSAVDDDWVGLHDLETAPEHRRQGWSSLLMAELLDRAGEQGVRTVHLQVREDNATARALYESLGFRTHHRYRYLTPGEDGP